MTRARRAASRGGAAATLRVLLCLAAATSCGGWHAFLDAETLPNSPGERRCRGHCCTAPRIAPPLPAVDSRASVPPLCPRRASVTGTALPSDLQLPMIERKNTVCVSDPQFQDRIGQRCVHYAEAPAERCAGEEAVAARLKCCACGGGTIIENTQEICEIATTSLNRAIIMCAADAEHISCSNECVASWNSVVRDAETLVGVPCPSLETLMNEAYPRTMSGGGTFNQDELVAIATNCAQFCPEETASCGFSEANTFLGASPAPKSYWLRPPASVCPNFKLTDGVSQYPVLTWQVLESYVARGWGCTGGLSLLADEDPQSTTHYSSWACVYEPSCRNLFLNDDMVRSHARVFCCAQTPQTCALCAPEWCSCPRPSQSTSCARSLIDPLVQVCFKYAKVRGEFHYWGVNSELTLASLNLFMVNVSFCDASGTVLLKDALNRSRLIDLQHVNFNFTRVTTNGEKPHVIAGLAPVLFLPHVCAPPAFALRLRALQQC